VATLADRVRPTPNGIQLTSCHVGNVDHFGLYGVKARPVTYSAAQVLRNRPRYLFDGVPITSESDWI